MVNILTFMKPDAILRSSVGANILYELANDEFLTIKSIEKRQVPPELVDEHYSHLVKRPFYPWLKYYTMATPVFALILEGKDGAIEHLRAVLGDTMSHNADEGTIRNKYGIYSGVNCLHASDSVEGAQRELEIWSKYVGIKEGNFDLDIDSYIEANRNIAPILTNEIRQICYQMADGNKTDESRSAIRELLIQECVGASDDEIDKLLQIIDGAVS